MPQRLTFHFGENKPTGKAGITFPLILVAGALALAWVMRPKEYPRQVPFPSLLNASMLTNYLTQLEEKVKQDFQARVLNRPPRTSGWKSSANE